MGCGRSKFESDREAEAKGKIPPLIRRRIEEIKRKRHEAAVKNTLSKKKLLKAEGTEEEDNSESSGSKESMRKAIVAPEPQTVCCDLKKDEKIVEAIAPTMEEIKEEKEKEDEEEEEEEEDDEGRLSSVNDAMIFPGSPSFRVYCIEQTTETSNDEVCKDDVSSEKLKACDSSEMDSVVSTEDSPDKSEKRKKGRRFRILPKGSRNFLGCYNGDRNKHQLLTHKVAA